MHVLIISMRSRGAKLDHHSIPNEFIDSAFVLEDRIYHQGLIFAQQIQYILWIHLF